MLRSDGCDFLGVTMIGPDPIGVLHVPLDNGVQSLYGLNGSGKTRVLRQLRQILSGQTSADTPFAGWLHVQLSSPPGGQPRGAFATGLFESLSQEVLASEGRAYVEARSGSQTQQGHEWYRRQWSDRSMTTMTDVVYRQLCSRFNAVWAYLDTFPPLDDLLEGVFALVPTGTAATGAKWDVYAAGDMWGLWWESCMDVAPVLARLAPSGSLMEEVESLPAEQSVTLALLAESNVFYKAQMLFAESRGESWMPVDMPDYVTLPGPRIGEHAGSIFRVIAEGATGELNLRTAEVLQGLTSTEWLNGWLDEELAVDAEVTAGATAVAERATELARAVLSATPRLQFDWRTPLHWVKGDLPGWVACEDEDVKYGLDHLSAAQSRWAHVAIELALQERDGALPTVFLCDEPENGLHPQAESALPRALSQLFPTSQGAAIVATHSPSLLDAQNVSPLHVGRDGDGKVTVAPVQLASTDSAVREKLAEQLGLVPSDLLALTRVAVLVEGMHDQAALDALLGDQLGAAGATMLRLGGAKALPSLVDAQLLFEGTAAAIIFVLDNLVDDRIHPIWTAAQEAMAAGNARSAVDAVRELEALPGGEARWLRELADKAISSRKMQRLQVFGLTYPDVICYLDFTGILPDFKAWQPEIDAFHASKRVDIKKWLNERHGWVFSARKISRAASQTSSIHPDLMRLSARIQELGAFGWQSESTRKSDSS